MRKLAAGIGSLAIAVLTTAAGIVFDAKALIYGGILLAALAVILWLFGVGNGSTPPSEHQRAYAPPRPPIINIDPDLVTMLAILAGIPIGGATLFLIVAALFRLIGMVIGVG